MFKGKETTHIVAYLLHKAGGSIQHLDLKRMLYMADRSMYAKCDEPITGDLAISMEYGPALLATLALMEGFTESDFWGDLIMPLKNGVLSLTDFDQIARQAPSFRAGKDSAAI